MICSDIFTVIYSFNVEQNLFVLNKEIHGVLEEYTTNPDLYRDCLTYDEYNKPYNKINYYLLRNHLKIINSFRDRHILLKLVMHQTAHQMVEYSNFPDFNHVLEWAIENDLDKLVFYFFMLKGGHLFQFAKKIAVRDNKINIIKVLELMDVKYFKHLSMYSKIE